MIVKIPYYISNGGDGSASVQLCPTLEEAKKLDEDQDEGWGESSADTIEVKVEDGKVFFQVWDSNDKRIWVETKG